MSSFVGLYGSDWQAVVDTRASRLHGRYEIIARNVSDVQLGVRDPLFDLMHVYGSISSSRFAAASGSNSIDIQQGGRGRQKRTKDAGETVQYCNTAE